MDRNQVSILNVGAKTILEYGSTSEQLEEYTVMTRALKSSVQAMKAKAKELNVPYIILLGSPTGMDAYNEALRRLQS